MTATTGSAEAAPLAAPGIAIAVIVAGVALAFGWVLLAQKLGGSINLGSETASNAAFFLVLFAPLAAIALVAARLSGIRALRAGTRASGWIGAGAALGAAGFGATLALAWLQGGVVAGTVPAPALGVLLLGVVLTFFQTGVEEVFFRGWLQPALVARIGPAAGIAIGALCFAAFHLAGGARAPISLLNILLAGLWFGLLAWRSGGIVAGLAAHFAWNVIESSLLGLVPNPGSDVFGSLIDLDLLGAPVWGGHEEGLNASIGTIAVLLALIVPLVWRPRVSPLPLAGGAGGGPVGLS